MNVDAVIAININRDWNDDMNESHRIKLWQVYLKVAEGNTDKALEFAIEDAMRSCRTMEEFDEDLNWFHTALDKAKSI